MENGNGKSKNTHPLFISWHGGVQDEKPSEAQEIQEFSEREKISPEITEYLMALYSGDSPTQAMQKAGLTEIQVAAEAIRMPIVKQIQASAAHQLGLNALFEAYNLIHLYKEKTKWELPRGAEIAIRGLLQIAKMAAPGHFSNIAKNSRLMGDADKDAGKKASARTSRKRNSSMLERYGGDGEPDE